MVNHLDPFGAFQMSASGLSAVPVSYHAIIINGLLSQGDCDNYDFSNAKSLDMLLWEHAAIACSGGNKIPPASALLVLKASHKPPQAIQEVNAFSQAHGNGMSFPTIHAIFDGFKGVYGFGQLRIDQYMTRKKQKEEERFVPILVQDRCYRENSLSDKDLVMIYFNLLVHSKETIEESILYKVSPLVRSPIYGTLRSGVSQSSEAVKLLGNDLFT